MSQLSQSQRVFRWFAITLIWLALPGCPTAERTKPRPSPQPPGPAAQPEKEFTPAAQQAEKPRDLGSPLVDNLDKLTRLDPDFPVWLDKQNKQVVFLGEVCRADYPLEFFVTYRDRSYEAIVASDVRPSIIHAGLLALGADPGHPARFQPEFVPPTGTEVAIEVRWKDAKGRMHSSPARDWVRNVETKKALDANWVFAGSALMTDEETGKKHYLGDGGDFICLLNLPTAVLDLPIRSASALESRLFEAFIEHLPPPGTPVTLLLKPNLAP